MKQRYVRVLIALTALLTVLVGGFATSAQAEAKTGYKRMTKTEVSYARSVLALMNAQRAEHGLPKLKINRSLSRGAAGHNAAMARVNTVSHQLKGEKFFSNRMRAAGWKPNCASAENVGVNQDMSLAGGRQLQTLMSNEVAPNDGHRVNLLGRRYTHVGVAVLLDRAHGRLWLTIDFGQRRC